MRMLCPSAQPISSSPRRKAACGPPTPDHARWSPHRDSDPLYAIALLRVCRERSYDRRAAEKPDELPPPHSITSSASAVAEGMSTPMDLPVLKWLKNESLLLRK